LIVEPDRIRRFEQVLLLNATYEPLRIIGWQRAMILLASEKVEILEESAYLIQGVGRAFSLPSILRLLRRVRPRKSGQVRFSRRNVYLRDRYRCQYCCVLVEAREITCDHVIPRSRGGETSWENVVAACHRCNLKKGNRLPEEIGMRLFKKPIRPAQLPTLTPPRYPQGMPESWLTYLVLDPTG
jgi:5-methylcytosine-specific restriction endonuclease McrA